MRFFIAFLLSIGSLFSLHGKEEVSSLFAEKIPPLLQEEKWEEIVSLGETLLKTKISDAEHFMIADQLVSTYFRLGLFDKAKEKADELIALSERSNQPEQVIDSLYKLSAALRGLADSEKDSNQQQVIFAQSLIAIEKAYTIYKNKCPENKSLKARVLFNKGAICCDNPLGDVLSGIKDYKEAIALFSELGESDLKQRMMIRLGKAYLLINDLAQSREIAEQLKKETIETRTHMHLLYLDAQVCLAEGNNQKAREIAEKGKEIAVSLQAKHDAHRFEKLLHK